MAIPFLGVDEHQFVTYFEVHRGFLGFDPQPCQCANAILVKQSLPERAETGCASFGTAIFCSASRDRFSGAARLVRGRFGCGCEAEREGLLCFHLSAPPINESIFEEQLEKDMSSRVKPGCVCVCTNPNPNRNCEISQGRSVAKATAHNYPAKGSLGNQPAGIQGEPVGYGKIPRFGAPWV